MNANSLCEFIVLILETEREREGGGDMKSGGQGGGEDLGEVG